MEILALIGAVVLFLLIVGIALWQAGIITVTTEWDNE